MSVLIATAATFVLVAVFNAPPSEGAFRAGAAISDITGPVAQTNTMGYAHAHLSGLHTRLYSRVFAFRDSAGNSAAIAVLDLAMVSHLLAFTIGKRLSDVTSGRYSESNVLVSATHTHAGPGGYNQDLFLAMNTPGFDRKYFDYIVDAVVRSVLAADRRLAPARLLSNSGDLRNASVNRHPYQYLLNPAAERALYPDNVDTAMHLLRIDNAATGAPIGSLAWFPVHGTSLKVNNRFVSGDNKGIASLLMEGHFQPRALPGRQTGFVAAFPQSHSGDVTPNTLGIFRSAGADSADECNATVHSTFNCESRGPGWDQYDSAMIIGRMQFEAALKLHQSARREIPNPMVSAIHDVRDISAEDFPAPDIVGGRGNNGTRLRACKAALGYAFCAGTADGKALFSYFTNGIQRPSVLVDAVRDLLAPMTPEEARCQGSKRVCLNLGKMYWSGIPFMSSLIPTQILRLGSLFIVSLPTEVTTMAGRRLIKSLSQTKRFPSDGRVQLNTLSNGYFLYTTTQEEYNGSYYEAGATLFGPNTLNFYTWHLGRMLATLLRTGSSTGGQFQAQSTPNDLDRSRYLEAISGGESGSLFDCDFPGFSAEFGQQLATVNDTYNAGQTVWLNFVACNPRHSFGIRGHSFILVERYRPDLDEWLVVDTDAGLDTRFLWRQGDFFQSRAIVTWEIPAWQRPGDYRIVYQGHCKPLSSVASLLLPGTSSGSQGEGRVVRPVSGVSKRFRVLQSSSWKAGAEVRAADLLESPATLQRSASAVRLQAPPMSSETNASADRRSTSLFAAALVTAAISLRACSTFMLR